MLLLVESSSAQFQAHYNDITTRISLLVVQGSDTNERIGGIHALTALIDFKGDDASLKATRFVSWLRRILQGNDTTAMIVAAWQQADVGDAACCIVGKLYIYQQPRGPRS